MPPRHEKAARYLRLGIFDGVRSFASLEKRIAGLPEGDRGPTFEVFAEAYLATQKTQSAKEVWPGNTVPHRLETKFRLAGAVGVDGVFESLTGQVCGYQWNGKGLQCTGGQEKSRHSKGSKHYSNEAVDIAGKEFNKYQIADVLQCAANCGFTHGWYEDYPDYKRDHWHIQIGPGLGVPPLPKSNNSTSTKVGERP